jgi:hypothetical protein
MTSGAVEGRSGKAETGSFVEGFSAHLEAFHRCTVHGSAHTLSIVCIDQKMRPLQLLMVFAAEQSFDARRSLMSLSLKYLVQRSTGQKKPSALPCEQALVH